MQTRSVHTYFQDINDYLKANKKDQLPDSTKTTLQDQITEMEDPNHRIRDLVQRRIVRCVIGSVSVHHKNKNLLVGFWSE